MNIEEIKARESKATPGPWNFITVCSDEEVWIERDVYNPHAKEHMTGEDADFIVHAREDVPALVEAFEANGDMLARLRDLHKKTLIWRGIVCDHCEDLWPCETAEIIGADDKE